MTKNKSNNKMNSTSKIIRVFFIMSFIASLGECSFQSSSSSLSSIPLQRQKRMKVILNRRQCPQQQQQLAQRTQQRSSSLFMSSSSSSSSSSTTEEEDNNNKDKSEEEEVYLPKFAGYEYGEMSIIVEEMKQRNTPCLSLGGKDRSLMKLYLERIITLRPSLISLTDIPRVIPDSKWKLVYSTQDSTMENLPENASIYLDFKDDKDMNYVLQFSKQSNDNNFGVQRIAAKSNYQMAPGKPGVIELNYQDIQTDLFGLKNVNVPDPFGWFSDKGNVIESAFMDGHYWIEMGKNVLTFEDFKNKDTKKPELSYYNIYVRDFADGSPDEVQQQLFLRDLHEKTKQIGKQINAQDDTNKKKDRYASKTTSDDQWN